MRIEILESARDELRLGHVFYEQQRQGLGNYFLDSLFAASFRRQFGCLLATMPGMKKHSTTIDPDKAKALCTKEEYALVRESRARGLQGSARKSLATRLRRARTLRDKYHDLHRRQRGRARGKVAGGWLQPLHDAARTLAKAALFAEVVERFERAIAAVDDRERRAREKEARSADARALTAAELRRRQLETQRRARSRHVVPPPAAFGSIPGRPAPRPLRPIRTAVGKARSGHSRSSFRRQQARRDGRR